MPGVFSAAEEVLESGGDFGIAGSFTGPEAMSGSRGGADALEGSNGDGALSGGAAGGSSAAACGLPPGVADAAAGAASSRGSRRKGDPAAVEGGSSISLLGLWRPEDAGTAARKIRACNAADYI